MAVLARTEFSSALAAVANERGLDPEVILETVREAMVAAYRRDACERGEEIPEETNLEATIDPESGEVKIYTWEEGKKGKKRDVTPPGFGRIAAQTAKQVLLQKNREAEKDLIMGQYKDRTGSLITGTVLRFDGSSVRVDLGRAEGTMPASERIPNERLNLNQRLTFLLKEIEETERGGEIVLSRAGTEIVKKLFAREVPEIGSGAVEIKAIAREPGSRTKVAVASGQSGVDPVGSCVGQKGVRVQAVINELNGEKIDVIPWTEESEQLIKSALSPAEGTAVSLNKKSEEARVTVPEDQLSLAIGKEGQNVRLASKLTGWKIEIEAVQGEKTLEQAEEEKGKVKSEKKVEVGKKKAKKAKEKKTSRKEKSGKSKDKPAKSAEKENGK